VPIENLGEHVRMAPVPAACAGALRLAGRGDLSERDASRRSSPRLDILVPSDRTRSTSDRPFG
jgi:hypothetical protein